MSCEQVDAAWMKRLAYAYRGEDSFNINDRKCT